MEVFLGAWRFQSRSSRVRSTFFETVELVGFEGGTDWVEFYSKPIDLTPQKSNIDTKSCHSKGELPFPKHHFRYPC